MHKEEVDQNERKPLKNQQPSARRQRVQNTWFNKANKCKFLACGGCVSIAGRRRGNMSKTSDVASQRPPRAGSRCFGDDPLSNLGLSPYIFMLIPGTRITFSPPSVLGLFKQVLTGCYYAKEASDLFMAPEHSGGANTLA